MVKKQQFYYFFQIVSRFFSATGILFLISFFTATTVTGATLYKNYVVRYDRGWDILCDPYEVQPGDWVLKIFRQKGEIAHEDFRDFLRIFHRLNPHVTDVNLIRPGQVIDIPIKKMKKGHLPGQDSGMVTIPFIMVDESIEAVKQYTREYTVQRGDTLSQLISSHFGGRFGNATFREGLSLFKAVNPHIKNADQIYAGARIHMPDPSIREQEWYDSLFDAQGNLTEKTAEIPEADLSRPFRPTESTPSEKMGPAAEAAAMVGGRLLDKGTHYIPMEQGETFDLDLSRYPVIDISPSPQIILSTGDQIMGVDAKTVRSYRKDLVKVARISEGASAPEIVQAVLSVLDPDTDETPHAAPLTVSDNGVQIQITAKWIHTPSSSNDDDTTRYICITPISTAAQQTDPKIVRYLALHQIDIRDILSGMDVSSGVRPYPAASAASDAAVATIEQIDSRDQKMLVEAFSRLMGFHYAPAISISFPYTGIRVEALSNLISFGNGRETLIDFGDLYGDAVQAIQNTGLNVVQISSDAEAIQILAQLLEIAGIAHTPNPVFYAADRPTEFNTAIMVPGILVTRPENPLLFTGTGLPESVTALLQHRGIRIVSVNPSNLKVPEKTVYERS